MALTRELITANSFISNLTEEQISAIITLSQNDENAVIAKKTGEIYGGLDTDILTASGIAKNGAEKTFDYAKRVIADFKGKVDGIGALNTQIADLTKEKARLEKVIADGGADAETKKQLTQAQTDLASVTKSFTDLKAEFDSAKESHQKAIFGMRLDSEFATATAELSFKKDIPTAVVDIIRKQAIDKVKGMFPSYVDDGKGGQTLVFKAAENGEILRNPENGLNPFTASELVKKELTTMGVLETTRTQGGAGGSGGQGGQGGSSVDVSGAKTQQDAYERIATSLMAKGLTNGSKEFDTEMQKAWKDNNIASLPLR